MRKNSERAFVKTIILIVIALVILGYYGFNVRDIMSSSSVHDNLAYGQEVTSYVWTTYLKQPIDFIWSDVFVKMVWEPILKPKY